VSVARSRLPWRLLLLLRRLLRLPSPRHSPAVSFSSPFAPPSFAPSSAPALAWRWNPSAAAPRSLSIVSAIIVSAIASSS